VEKDNLKALVTEMYEDLLLHIDQQHNATKEQVIEYLKAAADTLYSIDDNSFDATSHEKSMFYNAYQFIANQSLHSYETTNTKFEKITQMHAEALDECKTQHINLDEITSKFRDIQTHMTEEVQKANAIISELTKKVETLEEASNIDPLTKVFNRRALTSYLETMCSNKKTNYESHLLILDLDDFKQINDTYGHVAGDKILIFLSNILRKTIRDGDRIFRYGGEEFIIVLNRIDDSLCNKIAKRLLSLVSSNKLIYKGENLYVTMSIGATKYHQGDTPESFIDRADKALYKAKHNGKNQLYTEQ
jgi:diguanylate cyclase (GGDEF)-like protein